MYNRYKFTPKRKNKMLFDLYYFNDIYCSNSIEQGWRTYGTRAISGTLVKFQWHVEKIEFIEILINIKI